MADTILITGATGTVGKDLIEQLRNNSVKIRAAIRNRDKAQKMGWRNVDIVDFDFEKPVTFENALKDIDTVFLENPLGRMDADKYLKPFIDVARRVGIKHIVNLGFMGMEKSDNPGRRIEQYIEQAGILHTFLRPNWYMQNFIKSISHGINNQNTIALPAGEVRVSFLDTRDLASMAARVLTEEKYQNETYTPTGSESLDHYQVAKLIGDACGREIKYLPLSEDEARNYMKQMGWPDANINFYISLYSDVRAGIVAPITQDFKNVTGRDPITFKQFARDHASWWEKKPETVRKS